MSDEVISLEIRAPEPGDLEAAYKVLRGKQGIDPEFVTATPEPGYLGGVAEVLTVALSTGAVTAFLQLITALVKSRGPAVKLNIRRGKDKVEISSDSVEEGLSLLREITRGP